MRKPFIFFSVMSILHVSLLGSFLNIVQANSSLSLLEAPAKMSALASKSVLMAMIPNNDAVLAVGERGHIINWQNDKNWQQQQSPVSITITGVTILSDGSKIAVGHDGVILKANKNSTTWRKVFNGIEITKLKITLLKKQYETLTKIKMNTRNEDEIEELTYQLDDLAFAIEDNQLELKSGSNKPLLSVARMSNDTLFVCGAYGVLLTSLDKGESWQLVSNKLDNPDSYHLNTIIVTSNNQLYIVGENGLGFHSTNLGLTWSVMALPYSGSLFGIIANADNPTHLVAFGLQGNFMVSLDGGEIWSHQKSPNSASLLGGDFSKSGEAFLVGHGGLIVSFNPEKLESFNIEKHPSGAAFSSVIVNKNSLILAGQFGISQWPIKK